jgi:predicted dehydrogenase
MHANRLFCAVLFMLAQALAGSAAGPVTYAIVGLNHDHARGFVPGNKSRQDIQLVGIAEPDRELAMRYARDYKLSTNLFFANLEDMLEKVKPQAVATFTSTFEHRRVVEICAERGVHVMMEKPLAVSVEHALAMETAAKKGGIQVIVNYETTWYPANHAAFELVHAKQAVGELRKIVVHDGHQGPKEIGCSENFLQWLTDPLLNGGGALTDFGCYGADLITWLMDGQRPTSVFAVTQQIKPEVYPKVDDEATIVLTYPQAQGIIQASWNWPFGRKDMEVYGRTGYVLVPEKDRLQVRTANSTETQPAISPLVAPNNDPLSYLGAIVRGDVRPAGLSSLEINLIVTEILDAARESARTGRRVEMPERLDTWHGYVRHHFVIRWLPSLGCGAETSRQRQPLDLVHGIPRRIHRAHWGPGAAGKGFSPRPHQRG